MICCDMHTVICTDLVMIESGTDERKTLVFAFLQLYIAVSPHYEL